MSNYSKRTVLFENIQNITVESYESILTTNLSNLNNLIFEKAL